MGIIMQITIQSMQVIPQGRCRTVLVGAIIGAAVGAVTSGITYAASTENRNGKDFWANVAGGAVNGAVTGGCLGLGVGLLGGSACGSIGGAFGDLVTQSMDTQEGIKGTAVIAATAEGTVPGLLGNIGAAKINKGWLELANRNPGGLSAKNLLPWATTGSLGQKMQYNTLLGGLWDFDLGLGIKNASLINSARCSWGSR